MPARTQRELMRQALQYREPLVAYAYGMLRDWAAAEDAVQEALLVLMEKWQEYRPELGVFPWVRRMTYHKVQEEFRKRGREVPAGDRELAELVREAVERHMDEREAARHGAMLGALERCMERLKAAMVSVIVRYYGEGATCEEIAAGEGRSANAVWIALSRARGRLRKCIRSQLAREPSGLR